MGFNQQQQGGSPFQNQQGNIGFNQQQQGGSPFQKQQGNMGFNQQQQGGSPFQKQQGGFNQLNGQQWGTPFAKQQQGGLFNQQQGGSPFQNQQGNMGFNQQQQGGSPFQKQQGGFNRQQGGSPFQNQQGNMGFNQQQQGFQSQMQTPFQQSAPQGISQGGFQQQGQFQGVSNFNQNSMSSQQGQSGFYNQNQFQKPRICYQFRKGRCKFGSNCKFSHDLSLDDAVGMNVDTGMDMTTEDTATVQAMQQDDQDIDMDSTELFRVNSSGQMSDSEVTRSLKAVTSREPIIRAPSPDHPADPLLVIKSPWEDELVAEEAEIEEEIKQMWAQSGDLNRFDWTRFGYDMKSFEIGKIPTNAPPRRLGQEERSRIIEKEEFARVNQGHNNSQLPSRYCTSVA